MELKVIAQKGNPLLSRAEIELGVVFEKATPSKEEIKKQIAAILKVGEKLIVVKNIYGHFGDKRAKVLAYQYFNEEDMKKIEPKQKEKKAREAGEAQKKGKKPAPKENDKE